MSALLFWSAFILISTHYLFFPLAVLLLARFRSRPPQKAAIEPTFSLIIAAYDEEKVLREKLENSLALDYPRTKLEILVVSDGSTDRTPDIAASFREEGVISLHAAERRGKASALNRAVDRARGEILLFSDANSFYRPEVPRILAPAFADPRIGGVSGRKSILSQRHRESSRGDRFFWDVESRLKKAESQLGSIPTGDGEIFAVRRSAFRRLRDGTINDDMAITLDLVRQGLRVVYESEAISEEQASLTLEDDFRVKARMVSGAFQTLGRYRDLLLPPRSPFAVQFLLHKTLRHVMPVLLALLFGASLALAAASPGGWGFYRLFLALQIAFYGAAAAGLVARRWGAPTRLLYPPLYYCLMNLAALRGLAYFLRGADPVAVWKKAER